ncbi:MAG: hypothetical protein JNJ46_17970 [Myxococcales bacterium]|nr:hypothetical protein [Myxococcales bacterium]
MKRLGSRWRPLAPADVAEAARDLVARAQAALSDEYRAGAERQILQLYDLLIPTLDKWALSKSADAHSATPALLDLWHELADIDAERESIEELLLWNAGHRDGTGLPALATSPAEDDAQQAAQRDWLAQALKEAPLPCSHWWRQLVRRAQGSLDDCAHITVQREASVVVERPPPTHSITGPQPGGLATTSLGALQSGDRLTLRWPLRLPGRVLVLHALGDERDAELTQVLPAPDGDASEGVPRRAHEVVEVVGEVLPSSAPQDGQEHSLILIWGPEMLPAAWGQEVISRRCVPVGSRVWRYTYSVYQPVRSEP